MLGRGDWRAYRQVHQCHPVFSRVRSFSVSNLTAQDYRTLTKGIRIKPTLVNSAKMHGQNTATSLCHDSACHSVDHILLATVLITWFGDWQLIPKNCLPNPLPKMATPSTDCIAVQDSAVYVPTTPQILTSFANLSFPSSEFFLSNCSARPVHPL